MDEIHGGSASTDGCTTLHLNANCLWSSMVYYATRLVSYLWCMFAVSLSVLITIRAKGTDGGIAMVN